MLKETRRRIKWHERYCPGAARLQRRSEHSRLDLHQPAIKGVFRERLFTEGVYRPPNIRARTAASPSQRPCQASSSTACRIMVLLAVLLDSPEKKSGFLQIFAIGEFPEFLIVTFLVTENIKSPIHFLGGFKFFVNMNRTNTIIDSFVCFICRQTICALASYLSAHLHSPRFKAPTRTPTL